MPATEDIPPAEARKTAVSHEGSVAVVEVASETGMPDAAETSAVERLLAKARRESRAGEIDAESTFGEALRAARAAGDPASAASVLEHLAVYLAYAGRYPDAADRFLSAAEMYREIGVSRRLAAIHNWLGWIHRKDGDPAAAETYYRQALEHALELRQPAQEARARNAVAALDHQAGELGPAVEGFLEARRLFRELGRIQDLAQVETNLGDSFTELGQYDRALDHLERAVRLFEAAGRGTSRNTLVAVWNAVAWAQFLADRPEQALDSFAQAQSLWTEETDALHRAGTLGRLGSVYFELGRRDEALAHFRSAESLAAATGHLTSRTHSATKICAWFETSPTPEVGLAACDRAVGFAAEVSNPGLSANAHYHRARLFYALRGAAAAEADALRAVRDFETLSSSVAGRRARLKFVSDGSVIHRFLVRILMDLGQVERALEESDRLRSRTLAAELDRAGLDWRRRRSAADRSRARALTLRMAMLEDRRDRPEIASDPEALREVERSLWETYRQYDRLEDLAAAQVPERHRILGSGAVRVGRIQEVLDSRTAVVVFSLGEEVAYAWVVRKESVRGFELPVSGSEIERRAVRFQRFLSDPSLLAFGDLRRTWGDSLGSAVLEPVFEATNPGERILLVSEAELRSVPFSALPYGESSGGSDDSSFLLERNAIVNLPSLSVLLALAERPEPETDGLLVLADPIYSSTDPRAPAFGSERREGEIGFRRLEAAGLEARRIRSRLPKHVRARFLFGSEVTTEILRKRDLDLHGYRILHFASHGVLDSEHPELSSLVLSRFDHQGRPLDPHLRVSEILDLELRAALVVASACHTGLGGELEGEARSVFTRAFLAAGASRVVVSRWLVDDWASAELMAEFYGHLFRGSSPPAALREAKLGLLESRRFGSPYFWAPYVLQGDWRAFDREEFPGSVNSSF